MYFFLKVKITNKPVEDIPISLFDIIFVKYH